MKHWRTVFLSVGITCTQEWRENLLGMTCSGKHLLTNGILNDGHLKIKWRWVNAAHMQRESFSYDVIEKSMKVNFNFSKASFTILCKFYEGHKRLNLCAHVCRLYKEFHVAYLNFLEHRWNASAIFESSPAAHRGHLTSVVGSIRWHTNRNCNSDARRV